MLLFKIESYTSNLRPCGRLRLNQATQIPGGWAQKVKMYLSPNVKKGDTAV